MNECTEKCLKWSLAHSKYSITTSYLEYYEGGSTSCLQGRCFMRALKISQSLFLLHHQYLVSWLQWNVTTASLPACGPESPGCIVSILHGQVWGLLKFVPRRKEGWQPPNEFPSFSDALVWIYQHPFLVLSWGPRQKLLTSCSPCLQELIKKKLPWAQQKRVQASPSMLWGLFPDC
jgi:hypothetical protein